MGNSMFQVKHEKLLTPKTSILVIRLPWVCHFQSVISSWSFSLGPARSWYPPQLFAKPKFLVCLLSNLFRWRLIGLRPVWLRLIVATISILRLKTVQAFCDKSLRVLWTEAGAGALSKVAGLLRPFWNLSVKQSLCHSRTEYLAQNWGKGVDARLSQGRSLVIHNTHFLDQLFWPQFAFTREQIWVIDKFFSFCSKNLGMLFIQNI